MRILSRFDLETMWGKWGNSLSCLLWRYVPVFYTTKFIQTEIYKKRKVSAMCLIEDPPGKNNKNIQIFIISRAFWGFCIAVEGRKSQGSLMMSIPDAPLVIAPFGLCGCAAKVSRAPAEFM